MRAAEPCLIFKDDATHDWLFVVGRQDLRYDTKGMCDKRLPLVNPLGALLQTVSSISSPLLFPRRDVFHGDERPSLGARSLHDLIQEFQSRLRRVRAHDARSREQVRRQLLREAGGMDYDQIQGEFNRLAKSLRWPSQSTLKDLRHLFSTSLENSGVPLFYRRYLMRQSPGQSPVVTYTHINELRQ